MSGHRSHFACRHPEDIHFTLRFLESELEGGASLHRSALLVVMTLICLHPFEDGNHRTSLLAGELLLVKNGYLPTHPSPIDPVVASDEQRLRLQQWRLEYEADHELERVFFSIAVIERVESRISALRELMRTVYGRTIERWLVENYKCPCQ